jgi:membrane associated rhomboid family serine protease
MILLVPITPEVAQSKSAHLWPGLVLIIILCLGYLRSGDIVERDAQFVDDLYSVGGQTEGGITHLTARNYHYLALRPLLKIAPAPRDWDYTRLFYANFLHGGLPHLLLNLIGAFAGARLLATFLPFLCTLSIFILGGSFGILVSLWLANPTSEYVPHVGASGGIFAMMGAYYVYNFRYRTKYFFWFPSREQGLIALKTSWFFFLDVILLELVLSAAQLFPSKADSVDHLAHVFGFGAGVFLALFLRFAQRWPMFLQTRAEFLYWSKMKPPAVSHPIFTPFERWAELLQINPYNDQLKLKLFRLLYDHCERLSEKQIELAFTFISPTFIRLYPQEAAVFIKEVLSKGLRLPRRWLERSPYDSIIYLAKQMTYPPEEQYLLVKLVSQYHKSQPRSSEVDLKLEMLMSKLKVFMPAAGADLDSALNSRDESSGSSPSNNTPQIKTGDNTLKRAKKGSQ